MSHFSKFTTFFKADLQSALEYKGMMAIWMFDLFFMPLTMLFVWSSIILQNYHSYLDPQGIINYYLLLPLVSVAVTSWHGIFMAQEIRTGYLGKKLIKPIFPLISDISNNLAEKTIKIFILLPFLMISFSLFSLKLNLSLENVLWCGLSLVTSIIFTFSLETLMGIAGFWLEETSAIENFVDITDYTLGGKMIPLFLFPTSLKLFTTYMPFRYSISFPLEIITNSLTQQQIMLGFLIEFFWIGIIALLSRILWIKGIKKYTAYGN